MKFIGFLILVFSNMALACPYCAGDPSGPDQNSFIIITIAVALIYIPFYLLFRTAFKKASMNMDEIEEGDL